MSVRNRRERDVSHRDGVTGHFSALNVLSKNFPLFAGHVLGPLCLCPFTIHPSSERFLLGSWSFDTFHWQHSWVDRGFCFHSLASQVLVGLCSREMILAVKGCRWIYAGSEAWAPSASQRSLRSSTNRQRRFAPAFGNQLPHAPFSGPRLARLVGKREQDGTHELAVPDRACDPSCSV